MAKIIDQDFEFSKNWEDRDDFPTRETLESKVREDIQLLFDELKNYINDTVIAAINNHENRIATLGGGGTVEHDYLGDEIVWTDNIKDEAVTGDKLAADSVTPSKLDEAVDEYVEDLFEEFFAVALTTGGATYPDLASYVKHIVNEMELTEWIDLEAE